MRGFLRQQRRWKRGLVRYIFVPLRAPKKPLGLFLYMLFYEACLYWLNLWALFTVKNTSWVTRQVSAQA